MYLLALSFAAVEPAEWRGWARRGWVGEISGHFEHPAALTPSAHVTRFLWWFMS